MDTLLNLISRSESPDPTYQASDIIHTQLHYTDHTTQTPYGTATQCNMSESDNSSTISHMTINSATSATIAEHNRRFYRIRVNKRTRREAEDTEEKHEVQTVTPEDTLTDIKNNNRIKQYHDIRRTIGLQLDRLLYNSLYFETFETIDTEVIQAKNIITSFLTEYDFLEPAIHHKYITKLIPQYIKLKYPHYQKTLDNKITTIIKDFIFGTNTHTIVKNHTKEQLEDIVKYNPDKAIENYKEYKPGMIVEMANRLLNRTTDPKMDCTAEEIFTMKPVRTEMSQQQKDFRRAVMWHAAVGSGVLLNYMINPN